MKDWTPEETQNNNGTRSDDEASKFSTETDNKQQRPAIPPPNNGAATSNASKEEIANLERELVAKDKRIHALERAVTRLQADLAKERATALDERLKNVKLQIF